MAGGEVTDHLSWQTVDSDTTISPSPVPQAWKQTPTPTGPMTEPVSFETKFNTHCHGCRRSIPRGALVHGIKQAGGKWIIWHPNPDCLRDVVAKELVTGVTKVVGAPPSSTRRTKEQEWMELYDTEKKNA